ncbi:transposase [Streptomyces sp. NPDC002143]
MRVDLSRRLVPDELWELTAPLMPRFTSRPQGGGTAPVDERAVFTAVVYVLTSGCAWRYLPESFGVEPATAHGSPRGPRPDCGAGCTGRCWTNLAPRVSWTGRPRSSMPCRCGQGGSLTGPKLILAIPAVRSRRGPRRRKPVKVRADKTPHAAFGSSNCRD